MKIDIPDHRMREIAEAVGDRRRQRNQAQTARDYLAMELHGYVLAGADLVLDHMSPDQRKAFEAMVDAAMPDQDNR